LDLETGNAAGFGLVLARMSRRRRLRQLCYVSTLDCRAALGRVASDSRAYVYVLFLEYDFFRSR